ncbi:MAG: TauD/TfdA family dioxygenase [Candidatus Thioglobus sp.]|nr:MAG: TauD/TfdA family dioxygenase [Candidatus Thioglobus sp.]KAA0450628.1 MAG: TauD/TfdA family dioxygenase [Candidatus Thioglobus sp.]
MQKFLDNYQFWRDEKLANAAGSLEECLVEVANPQKLTAAEAGKIKQLCADNNFALFTIPPQSDYPRAIIDFNQQFDLTNQDQHLYLQNDGLAHITQSSERGQSEFIPYTDRAIGWHTDGYYNAPSQRIRAFSLFCVTPAASGGISQWIDPQMAYILLREKNADAADALANPQALGVPEHIVDGIVRRAASVGPIFFIDEQTRQLSMRYTQRKRYILPYSAEVGQAVEVLDDILQSKNPQRFEYRLDANQGIICNNVIHNRSTFTDDLSRPRLLLRGRYGNRI